MKNHHGGERPHKTWMGVCMGREGGRARSREMSMNRNEMEDSREQRIDRLAKMEGREQTRRRRVDRVQRVEPC